MNAKIPVRRLGFFILAIIGFLLFASALTVTKVKATTTTTFVAIGDSNTTPWLGGTTSWFTLLENKLRTTYPTLNLQFTNLAVNGTSVTPTYNGSTPMQYDINAALSSINETDIGLIMLGTNDAWQGQPVADFQNHYKAMIAAIKNSGKIDQLYIMAVPPEISPYNCIGSSCWRNTHNPQTERVVPFNTFLSGISTYCTTIGYTCSYINSAYGIQLSTSYLNAGDGIHLLNNSQNIVATNVFNVVKANTAVTQVAHNFASFVSQDVNTNVLSGTSIPVRVTMKNTGLTTWKAADGYKLGALANGNFFGNYVNLSTSDVIEPGQQKDFIFNITVPKAAGTYQFKWRMMKGTAYFGDTSATVNINVYQARGATFVSQTVPTVIDATRTAEISVTMFNSGTTNWTGDEQYGLALANATNWGVTRVYLAPGEVVAPGEQKTFTFNVTAPGTAGTHYLRWQMIQESGNLFGAFSPNTPVTIKALVNNAVFVSQTVPTTMVAGRTAEATITFTNSGTSDWTVPKKYKLGAVYNYWSMARVALNTDEIIRPGESRTFTFMIKAPATAGNYYFQYRMIQEGVQWFGTKSTLTTIKVIPQTNNATFVSQNIPTTLAPGQTAEVSVTMLNSGTKDWKYPTYHKLGILSPNVWGIKRVLLGTTEIVAPGQERTFTFIIKAPITPGTYNFQWRMIQEGVQWFGASSDTVQIVVQ